jgi:hypothetical protein
MGTKGYFGFLGRSARIAPDENRTEGVMSEKAEEILEDAL